MNYSRFYVIMEACIVSLADIRANNANLSIPLYVRPATPTSGNTGPNQPDRPLAEVIAGWQASSQALRGAMGELFDTLKEANYG